MSKSYRRIELENWPRRQHCEVFRNYVEASYSVSFEVDITEFIKATRTATLPFSFSLIFLVSRVANGIEAFRYRFLEGEVVLYDEVDTAFTYMSEGSDLFKVVRVPLQATIQDYVHLAKKTAEEQQAYFTGPLGNDVFQFSPLPWIRFTHVSHTISGKKEQATPLFDWGKYYSRDGKTLLPFSVQVHHSFVDGYHVGLFAERLQEALDHCTYI